MPNFRVLLHGRDCLVMTGERGPWLWRSACAKWRQFITFRVVEAEQPDDAADTARLLVEDEVSQVCVNPPECAPVVEVWEIVPETDAVQMPPPPVLQRQLEWY